MHIHPSFWYVLPRYDYNHTFKHVPDSRLHVCECLQQSSSPDRSTKTTNTEDSADYVHITITPGDVIDINLMKDKVSTSSEESSPSLSRRRKSATSPSVRYRNVAKKLELSRDVTTNPQESVEDVKTGVTVRAQ